MPLPHQVPPLCSDSINHVGRPSILSDWYIMKKESAPGALRFPLPFAFLSQVMMPRRRLEPRNMLTKTSELRVRSVEGTTLPPRKKKRRDPLPSRLMPYITERERVTLEVNDQRCHIITTMRLVPLLVDSAMNMNEEMNAGSFC
jgi:hypothetical protein